MTTVIRTKVSAGQFMKKTIGVDKFSPTLLVNSINSVGNIILVQQQDADETSTVEEFNKN